MITPRSAHNTPQSLPDLYENECTASAIATAELIHSGQFALADTIFDSSDPLTLLQGFTNALGIAVQLISRHRGIAQGDVYDLFRAANNMATRADGNPNLDQAAGSH